jgi:hypothetical protein
MKGVSLLRLTFVVAMGAVVLVAAAFARISGHKVERTQPSTGGYG